MGLTTLTLLIIRNSYFTFNIEIIRLILHVVTSELTILIYLIK